jgi:hypothetical protein
MGLVFNPYHWEIRFESTGTTYVNPELYLLFISLGPVWLRVVIDDGRK